MARQYKQTRNIIQSCIDAIRDILIAASYTNVTVVKTFKKAWEVPIDKKVKSAVVCVRVGNTDYNAAEVGSNLTERKPLILIDLFCSSDGQREDLKDILIASLKYGFDYYEYTINGGETFDATFESGAEANGRIVVEDISDTPINLNIDKTQLDIHDSFRHLITLSCAKTLLEA